MESSTTPLRKTSKDILPSEKKEELPYSSVKFQRTWAFWESYIDKENKIKYEDSNKIIFEWGDLITFFQFWNKYPGKEATNVFFDGTNIKYFSEEKYRITAMNIFIKGVKPLWEDENNNNGKYLQLEYKINKDELSHFSKVASGAWKKLALNVMGECLPAHEFINGIRFVDKTDFKRGKIIMFRIEVWLNKKVGMDDLNKLVDYLKTNLGCEFISIRDIKA